MQWRSGAAPTRHPRGAPRRARSRDPRRHMATRPRSSRPTTPRRRQRARTDFAVHFLFAHARTSPCLRNSRNLFSKGNKKWTSRGEPRSVGRVRRERGRARARPAGAGALRPRDLRTRRAGVRSTTSQRAAGRAVGSRVT